MNRPGILATLALLLATTVSAAAAAQPGGSDALGELPATFFGELPCASCPAIQTTVTLRPDGVFLLRRVYVGAEDGQDGTSHDVGRWSLSDDGKALSLRGAAGTSDRFAVLTPDRLEMLDTQGRRIDSELDYGLSRVAPDPIRDSMRWRGMYRYMADAARFGECMTGLSRATAFELDHISLERAYLEARSEPGAPLLVTFDGHLDERPPMEGDGLEEVFIVEAFDAVWPGESCEPSKPDVTLTNTYWRLVDLGGNPVEVAEGQLEPHLRMSMEDRRLAGSGGCNRMMGSLQLTGTRLSFGFVATTRMTCPKGMEQEVALVTALEATAGYRITGETLKLQDETGAPLARFEATYFQ